jgi:hypothetical protein
MHKLFVGWTTFEKIDNGWDELHVEQGLYWTEKKTKN